MEKSKVLIVDDSRVGLMHLVQILQEDYIIHTAGSGVEAVQTARLIMPDIILMDIVMPRMDGYEALTVLQGSNDTKGIPVIFITSLEQEGNEEKGLTMDAVDFISKPYRPAIVKLRVSIQLKIVKQVREINRLSLIDSVTKLPNRHFFDLKLKEEFERAKVDNRKLSLLLLDIDNMRHYNATYGYPQGNKILEKVAEMIQKEALSRPGDFAARWANDVFAILLLDTDMAEANSIGENIRRVVEETPVENETGHATFFTLSLGGSSVIPASGETDIDAFIAAADSALFLAEELGRNQVVVQ